MAETRIVENRIVGIGSAHGDDAVGWAVVDRLRDATAGPMKTTAQREFDKVAKPIDLIDLFETSRRLHVIDASKLHDTAVLHLDLSIASQWDILANTPTAGTHDFGLFETLELARSLGRGTDRVQLWLVAGEDFSPFSPITASARRSVDQCVRRLITALSSQPRC